MCKQSRPTLHNLPLRLQFLHAAPRAQTPRPVRLHRQRLSQSHGRSHRSPARFRHHGTFQRRPVSARSHCRSHGQDTLRANGYSLRRTFLQTASPRPPSTTPISSSTCPAVRSTAFSTTPAPPSAILGLAKKSKPGKVEDPYGEDPATYQRILEELESRVLLLAARLRDRRRAAPALNRIDRRFFAPRKNQRFAGRLPQGHLGDA